MENGEKLQGLYSSVNIAVRMFVGALALSNIDFRVDSWGNFMFTKDGLTCMVTEEALQKLYDEELENNKEN